MDSDGNDRSAFVPFTLPDYDVFEIDAETLAESRRLSGVGTILFNMVVNPVDGTLYVSNLDSNNHIRFSGTTARSKTSVRATLSVSKSP